MEAKTKGIKLIKEEQVTGEGVAPTNDEVVKVTDEATTAAVNEINLNEAVPETVTAEEMYVPEGPLPPAPVSADAIASSNPTAQLSQYHSSRSNSPAVTGRRDRSNSNSDDSNSDDSDADADVKGDAEDGEAADESASAAKKRSKPSSGSSSKKSKKESKHRKDKHKHKKVFN